MGEHITGKPTPSLHIPIIREPQASNPHNDCEDRPCVGPAFCSLHRREQAAPQRGAARIPGCVDGCAAEWVSYH